MPAALASLGGIARRIPHPDVGGVGGIDQTGQMTDYAWRNLEIDGLERLRLVDGATVEASSVVDSAQGRYAYELRADSTWRFRALRVESAAEGRTLEIRSDAAGSWTVDGAPRGDLEDCIDIDLTVSPFTNTLPIRRLGLGIDDEADVVVAYVSFPDLEVTVEEQRYTRLDDDLYRFESLDSDFTRDIRVDASGIVLDYPGLFERL